MEEIYQKNLSQLTEKSKIQLDILQDEFAKKEKKLLDTYEEKMDQYQ